MECLQQRQRTNWQTNAKKIHGYDKFYRLGLDDFGLKSTITQLPQGLIVKNQNPKVWYLKSKIFAGTIFNPHSSDRLQNPFILC